MNAHRGRRGLGAALVGTATALALLGVPAVAGVAGAQPSRPSTAAPCAVVSLTAKPPVNTSSVPERIRAFVANCSAASETVDLVETLSGPFARAAAGVPTSAGSMTHPVTLAAGASATWLRHIPYSCCGTYSIRLSADTTTGKVLDQAMRSFTFA